MSGEGKEKCLKLLRQNILLILLALAMAAGIGLGMGIREADESFITDKRRLMYLGYPGELLMRMLKAIVIPVVILSVVSGVANLPMRAMGKLGWRVILYYMATTFSAVLLGILMVTTIRPGDRGQETVDKSDKEDPYVHTVDSLLDLIRNMFPSNIVAATFEQTRTTYVTEERIVGYRIDAHGENDTLTETDVLSFSVTTGGSSNVLGLIVFSIALGLALGAMEEESAGVRDWFTVLLDAVIKIVRVIIWYSPIGILFLLASRIVAMDDPATRFYQLMFYIITVLVGLGIHAFIILPLLYFILTRKNPFKLFMNMLQALLTALGTASSSATLPITMRCIEDNHGVTRLVSRFVLPVGATINMDGTALYEAVASIFIAQYNDIDLSAGQVVTVSITATAAAIGAAGVPEAGLITMLIVLNAVGLPTEDIALIYAVDWFLDRCRTMVNVWGDSVGAAILDHHVGQDMADEQPKALDEPPESNGGPMAGLPPKSNKEGNPAAPFHSNPAFEQA